MALTINTNVMSLNAQRNTVNNMQSLQTTMSRLSSGLRVNTAKDDAAGLAIAERMHSQVRGLNMALINTGDGISLAEVADGALASTTDVLQRIRELAIRSRNGTNDNTARANLQTEFVQLRAEISRIRAQTSFNNRQILGTGATSYIFQVGASQGQTVSIVMTSLGSISAALAGATISTAAGASAMLATVNTAVQSVVTRRANLGAVMSRFENIASNIRIASEKQSAARGRIMDADFAAETANLSRTQILQQAGTAMIAQANQLPQNVLRLLQG
ncbi:MAG: flagellin [Tepidimonas sp.]|uniref:flagellin N-terminal helical domain-containing protein n=1 Tax=Tepidimonas sp. TaxID=2002775 RepID=UPI00259D696F|nr:flagellin [Tepidimonas sp.]MDM7456729.1 flagellin [Tepidimonas sp.]